MTLPELEFVISTPLLLLAASVSAPGSDATALGFTITLSPEPTSALALA